MEVLGFAKWYEIISKNSADPEHKKKNNIPTLLPLIKNWLNVKSVTNKKNN